MLHDDLTAAPITGDTSEPSQRVILTVPPDPGAPSPERLHQQECERYRRMLGARFKTARRDRGWSIADFQARSGINRGFVFRVEQGKDFTLETLWRLANAFGVHWADLLDDHGPGLGDTPTPASASIPFEQRLRAFGGRVYEVRALRHLSQRDVVARIALNKNTLVDIEAGRQNIRIGTLLRLAAGLGVHGADLLDDRQIVSREQARELHAELARLRRDLALAQARVTIGQRVAEHTVTERIASAVEQARRIVDLYDRPGLTAMKPKQIEAHVDARRICYEHLDRMCREGQRRHLGQRPDWAAVVALRDLARYLTETALDEQLGRNEPRLSRVSAHG